MEILLSGREGLVSWGQSNVAQDMNKHFGTDTPPLCLPCYYHRLCHANTGDMQKVIQPQILPQRDDNLALINAKDIRYRDCYFLGLTIKDEDLPWDQTQTDW